MHFRGRRSHRSYRRSLRRGTPSLAAGRHLPSAPPPAPLLPPPPALDVSSPPPLAGHLGWVKWPLYWRAVRLGWAGQEQGCCRRPAWQKPRPVAMAWRCPRRTEALVRRPRKLQQRQLSLCEDRARPWTGSRRTRASDTRTLGCKSCAGGRCRTSCARTPRCGTWGPDRDEEQRHCMAGSHIGRRWHARSPHRCNGVAGAPLPPL